MPGFDPIRKWPGRRKLARNRPFERLSPRHGSLALLFVIGDPSVAVSWSKEPSACETPDNRCSSNFLMAQPHRHGQELAV